jgi:hypothetical protein
LVLLSALEPGAVCACVYLCVSAACVKAPRHAHCVLFHGLGFCRGAVWERWAGQVLDLLEWMLKKERERSNIVMRATTPQCPVSGSTHVYGTMKHWLARTAVGKMCFRTVLLSGQTSRQLSPFATPRSLCLQQHPYPPSSICIHPAASVSAPLFRPSPIIPSYPPPASQLSWIK